MNVNNVTTLFEKNTFYTIACVSFLELGEF